MSNLNLFGKEWTNIVFENRNKLYGAYKLRQESAKTTFMALAIGVGILSLLFGSSYLYASKSEPTVVIVDITDDPIVTDVVDVPKKADPIIEKPKGIADDVTKAEATKADVMDNKKLTEVKVEKDENVKNNDLNAQKDFNDHTNSSTKNTEANNNGSLNTDGTKPGDVDTEKGNDEKGRGTKDGVNNLDNAIVKLVQNKAVPNEGYEKFFESFIKKFAVNNVGGNTTEMVVKLRFVVEKDGSFTDIQVLEDKFGLANEAIRVLKSMPKWKAAQHNGKTVRSMFTLPIKVKVNN